MALVGLMNMVFACAPPPRACMRPAPPCGRLSAGAQAAAQFAAPGPSARGAGRRYGGQFAFVEVINAMQRPTEFASAVRASTAVMGTAYVALGGIGYWSMGAVVPSVIIFGIGSGVFARLAANAILAQARPRAAARCPNPSPKALIPHMRARGAPHHICQIDDDI
jgi:hypothetical protein